MALAAEQCGEGPLVERIRERIDEVFGLENLRVRENHALRRL
jgi:hypothetical protein